MFVSALSQGGGWTVWAGVSHQGRLQYHLEPRGVAGPAQLPDCRLPPGGGEQQLGWRGESAAFSLRVSAISQNRRLVFILLSFVQTGPSSTGIKPLHNVISYSMSALQNYMSWNVTKIRFLLKSTSRHIIAISKYCTWSGSHLGEECCFPGTVCWRLDR